MEIILYKFEFIRLITSQRTHQFHQYTYQIIIFLPILQFRKLFHQILSKIHSIKLLLHNFNMLLQRLVMNLSNLRILKTLIMNSYITKGSKRLLQIFRITYMSNRSLNINISLFSERFPIQEQFYCFLVIIYI